MPRGTLVLVVGPSGAGKDTVIDGARAALEGDPRFVFPRRIITRPPGQPGEDYTSASVEEFAERKAAGGFAITWHAHGLDYGIPASIGDNLSAGRHVIVNASRAAVDEARRHYPPVAVACLRVSPDKLRARLEARGRETPAEIDERIARVAAFKMSGPDVTVIDNDGAPEEAVTVFVELLRALPT